MVAMRSPKVPERWSTGEGLVSEANDHGSFRLLTRKTNVGMWGSGDFPPEFLGGEMRVRRRQDNQARHRPSIGT